MRPEKDFGDAHMASRPLAGSDEKEQQVACQPELQAESSPAINVQPICCQKQISIHRLPVSERVAQTYEYDPVGQVDEIEVMFLLLVNEPLLGSCVGRQAGPGQPVLWSFAAGLPDERDAPEMTVLSRFMLSCCAKGEGRGCSFGVEGSGGTSYPRRGAASSERTRRAGHFRSQRLAE